MIVFYPNGEKTPLNNYKDYHIRHTADGFDELHFSVSTSDPQYPLLLEEMPIEAAGNNWIIKRIYDDDIACELNLDELKATGTRAFDSGSVTLQTLLSSVLPSGWTATGAAQSTIRRTIRMDFATPLDVISAAMEIYGVCMQFDVPNRAITVVVPSLQPVSGEYITDELNLRKLSYQGETTDFCTRLYAYGADGLSIADAVVNGSRYGLPYVDNHEYSDKVIVGYWEDSRYTVAENLYDDAVARLAELARPVQSYECDAIDLAKESDDYSFLAFRVHRKITLIDRKRSLRVVHQIVEYDEYPEEPIRSVVTLSSTAPTVTSVMRSQIETVERETQNTAVSEITRATELLTGAQGGYIVLHYDEDKKPYEMLIMDAANEADAVHVWRYNKNGWGYSANGVEGNYTLAATIDGGIVADFIKSGTIDAARIGAGTITAQKLDSAVTGAITDAQTTANGAASAAAAAQSTANGAASAAQAAQAAANSANKREQTVYISKPSGTSSVTAPTAWVTQTGNVQNTWTTTRPVYNSAYPVLFVCTVRETMNGTITATTPVIDQTTTVIDGGHITTGSIDAGLITTGEMRADRIHGGTFDGTDMAVTNLKATNVNLSGRFYSKQVVDGVTWEVAINNGVIEIDKNGERAILLTRERVGSKNALIEIYNDEGLKKARLSADGTLRFWDDDQYERYAISADGHIYLRDDTGQDIIRQFFSSGNGYAVQDYYTNGQHKMRIAGDGGIYLYGDTDATAAAQFGYDQASGKYWIRTAYVKTDLVQSNLLNETSRICSANLSSAGWYRAIVMNAGGNNPTHGELGELLKITIGREYGTVIGESHQIDFSNQWYRQVFDNEVSHSGVQYIDQIRTTGDSTHLYIDIHYTGTNENRVSVTFDVEGVPQTTNALYAAASLQAVSASPSGETVLASYSFSDNGAVQTFKDATINGVLDVTQRRCYATLSSAGWYRIVDFDINGSTAQQGASSFIVDINITKRATSGRAEAHRISLFGVYGHFSFTNEMSVSADIGITKIRYTYDGSDGHIDIYYNQTTANDVYVDFDVHVRNDGTTYASAFKSVNLLAVSAAPSGETILASYDFHVNGTGNINANGTVQGQGFYDFLLGVGNSIASGTNCDTITIEGKYTAGSTAVAGSIINSPFTSAFGMIVMRVASADRKVQIAIPNDATLTVKLRRYDGSSWTAWKTITPT